MNVVQQKLIRAHSPPVPSAPWTLVASTKSNLGFEA